jgi:hypothetical protein
VGSFGGSQQRRRWCELSAFIACLQVQLIYWHLPHVTAALYYNLGMTIALHTPITSGLEPFLQVVQTPGFVGHLRHSFLSVQGTQLPA